MALSSKKNYLGIDSEEDLRWEELRALFVGDQLAYIQQIQEILSDPDRFAKEIGKNLPEALRLSHRVNPELAKRLVDALQPVLEDTLAQSARQNTDELTARLQPIFGPAIRKSINDTFRRMDQSIKSIIVRRVKFWIEAKRTGRSFQDVMVSHSFTFRVKEIFLIHRETGLLLHHRAQQSQTQDADMMSSMLKAIQDFVNDSFRSDDGDSALGAVEFGGQKIQLEQTRYLVLAVVVSGQVPQVIIDRFSAAVRQIEEQYLALLADFDGDVEPFEATTPILDTCFAEGVDDSSPRRRTKFQRRLNRVLTLLVLVLLLVFVVYPPIERSIRWQRYLDKVVGLTGVVLVEEGRKNGKYYLVGMVTPTSPNLKDYLPQFGFDTVEVVVRPIYYRPYFPEDVLQKAQRVLQVPVGTNLKLVGDTLVAEGVASRLWIKMAESKIKELWEINYLKTDKLTSIELEDPKIMAEKIERNHILFHLENGSLTPDELDKAQYLVRDIQNLINIVSIYKKHIEIVVNGYTDGTGDRTFNQKLSEERAQTVYNFLVANGVSPLILRTVGHGFDTTEGGTLGKEERQSLRKVKIQIILKD